MNNEECANVDEVKGALHQHPKTVRQGFGSPSKEQEMK